MARFEFLEEPTQAMLREPFTGCMVPGWAYGWAGTLVRIAALASGNYEYKTLRFGWGAGLAGHGELALGHVGNDLLVREGEFAEFMQ